MNDNRLKVSSVQLLSILLITSVTSACTTLEESGSKSDIYDISYKADVAYTNKNWKIAEDNYIQLTRLVPNDARAFFRLGNIYLKQGNADKSVIAYKEAIFRDPEKGKYYNNLAVARIMQAEQTLKTAINKARQTDKFVTDAKIMLIRLGNINKRKTKH